MLKLNVPDMTCGHCAGMVTKAVKSVDAGATISVDLPSQTVSIDSAADASSIKGALEAAGYPTKTA
jgi:copper chaperone